jgi:hypothetical protein
MGRFGRFFFAMFLAAGSGTAVAAEPLVSGPRTLSAAEMDGITAGALQLGVLSSAVSTGNFALAGAQGAANATRTVDPMTGGFSESGLAGGAASAVGTGGGNAAMVGSSAASSLPRVNITSGAGLATPGGQAGFQFSYVSGGPVFLP